MAFGSSRKSSKIKAMKEEIKLIKEALEYALNEYTPSQQLKEHHFNLFTNAISLVESLQSNSNEQTVEREDIDDYKNKLSEEQKRYLYFEVIGTDNDMYGTLDEFIDYLDETNQFHLPHCLHNQISNWMQENLSQPLTVERGDNIKDLLNEFENQKPKFNNKECGVESNLIYPNPLQ